MGELKPGWKRVKLGDVVRHTKDRVDPATSGLERFVAGEHMDTDDLRIRRWGDIGGGYLGPAFHMRFKPGQVLYGSRRTYLRKVAVADFEGITANTTFVLEPQDPKVLLPELLPLVLQTAAFHEHSKRESKGSVNPYVNFSDLAWYEFALPPLEEQRRIANLCNAARGTLESWQQVADQARVVFGSAAREFFATPARGCLGQVAKVSSGGTPSRARPEYWGPGVHWVKTAEINYQTILATEETITPLGLESSAAKVMPRGTIVLAMYGQGATLGRVARLGIDAATNQACACIQPQTVDADFLYYFLVSQYQELRASAKGATQPNLNLDMVRNLEIPDLTNHRQREVGRLLRELDGAAEVARARVTETTAFGNRLLGETMGGASV